MKQLRSNAATIVVSAIVALFVVLVMQPFNGRASQNTLGLPTTGVFSGLTEQNSINNALDALLTCNSGSSAPINALGGSPKEGQCWLDTTSSTLKIKKRYSGAAWVVEGVIDVTNGLWIPAAGGGNGTVASAATTDLCASPQQFQTVTGTASITSFGSSCVVGTRRTLLFTGGSTLVYSSPQMVLPPLASYTTIAGDVGEFMYSGSGNWRAMFITPVNGQALVNPAVDVGSIMMTIAAAVPSSKYQFGFGQALTRASFPAYLAAVTRAQTGVATSGNATLATVSDTSGMGAGMPIEGTCLSAGTTIASVTGASITVNAGGNVITNGTCTITVFFTGYGASGSSTTVGVPDCRGRALAGRDDLGGTAASRLTTASTGFNANGAQLNAGGGAQATTLVTANLPPYTPAGTIANGAISMTSPASIQGGAGANSPGGGTVASTVAAGSVAFSQATSTFTGTAQGGASTAFGNVAPTLIVNCMVRVLAMLAPANDDGPIVRGRQPIAIARRVA